MASRKDKRELLAIYCLYEGLEDAILYTVGSEEDNFITMPYRMQSDDTERTVQKARPSLKKRLQREGVRKKS